MGESANQPCAFQSFIGTVLPVATTYSLRGTLQDLMASHAACLFWLLFDMTNWAEFANKTSAFGPGGNLTVVYLKGTGGFTPSVTAIRVNSSCMMPILPAVHWPRRAGQSYFPNGGIRSFLCQSWINWRAAANSGVLIAGAVQSAFKKSVPARSM